MPDIALGGLLSFLIPERSLQSGTAKNRACVSRLPIACAGELVGAVRVGGGLVAGAIRFRATRRSAGEVSPNPHGLGVGKCPSFSWRRLQPLPARAQPRDCVVRPRQRRQTERRPSRGPS
jgi:hypothetical protein